MALLHSETLPLKWEPPTFSLEGTDEKQHSLDEFQSKSGVLVTFTCNHCPYAMASWPLLTHLHNKFHQNIGFLAINPNDPITHPGDSFENMQNKVTEWNIPFPYVIDETQKIAKAFKAQCTPDPYLFKRKDDKWLLYYHGRINDNWQEPDQVTEKNLEAAIELLLRDEPPPESQPPSMGCSIKWKG